jgi:uncharacterized protein (TIGR03118 family)
MKTYKIAAAFAFCLSASAQTTGYTATPIVTNAKDPNLINPWGLSRPPASNMVEPHWWASDQAKGVSTLYNVSGKNIVEPLVVTIPPAAGGSIGSPTGTTYVNKDTFVFVTLDGTISEWFAGVKPATPGSSCLECHVGPAVLKVDNSTNNASYQGITVANNGGVNTLYVANANGGIETYDATTYANIPLTTGAFVDSKIPKAYTPAGIQAVGKTIYVTYNRNAGGGTGYVDSFDTTGKLLVRFKGAGWLDQPWGVAKAPSNFGSLSNSILVGNTGSGWIAAFSATTGRFKGLVEDSGGNAITLPGLWGLSFGAGNKDSGPTNVLYYNAGGAKQDTGVFGAIAAN